MVGALTQFLAVDLKPAEIDRQGCAGGSRLREVFGELL
jgi:hypothetical protein